MSDYAVTSTSTGTITRIYPVSADECKDHMNISHDTDDHIIDGYIKAATELLENRTNRVFISQTRKCVLNGITDSRYVHGQKIYPARSPLKSVTSITYVDSASGTTTTMPSSEYVVSAYERPGCISLAYNASWPSVRNQPDNITVTYVAGHDTASRNIPYNVKIAIEQIVAHWYRNRESHTEVSFSELPLGVAALLESEHLETYG